MNLPEDIRKPLITLLLTGIGGSIGTLAVEAWRPMSAPFWQHVAPSAPTSTLLSLCTILLLLVFGLSAWIVYLHVPKGPLSVRSRYLHIANGGASKSKKLGSYFCTHCLFQNPPIEAPLIIRSSDLMQCPSCTRAFNVKPDDESKR